MSFGNIGNNLFGAGNYNSPLFNSSLESLDTSRVAPQNQIGDYRGGTIKIEVTANDTQQSVARKAIFAHAKSAGLGDAQANDFADQWIVANAPADGKTYLYNLNGGNLAGLTDKEFEAIKAKGVFEDTLSPVIHHRAVANINSRLWDEQNPAPPIQSSEVVDAQASERLTPTEQMAAKAGIDNTAIIKAEINSRYDQPSMSAREASAAESLSNGVTDGLDSITGTDTNGIGAAINRQTVSAIRATGRILEAVGATETGQTLQQASSEVTRRDAQAEALVEKSAISGTLIARIGKDAERLPENVLDGLETAVNGDFSDKNSTGATVGRVVGGLHPAGDVRDIFANAQDVAENKKGSYVGLGGAVLGTVVPGAGDAAKPIIKANKEAITEGVEGLLKQTNDLAEAASKQADEATVQTIKQGKLEIEPGRTLSESEQKIADKLVAEGKTVKAKAEVYQKNVKNPDFEVNGVVTEFKYVSDLKGVNSEKLSKGLSGRILDGGSQASHVILDVSDQVGMTKEIAERGIVRAFGRQTQMLRQGELADVKITEVRVVGKDFDTAVPYIAQ